MNTPALASAVPAPSQEHRSHYVEDSHPQLGGPDGCAGAAASPITNAAIAPTAKVAPSAPRKNTLATAAALGGLTSLLLIDAVISPAGAGLVYIGTSSRPVSYTHLTLPTICSV